MLKVYDFYGGQRVFWNFPQFFLRGGEGIFQKKFFRGIFRYIPRGVQMGGLVSLI